MTTRARTGLASPIGFAAIAALALLLTACATPAPYDYTEFRRSSPASLLVLPPINDSAEVRASDAVLATASAPLAEAGYYVMPVGMVRDTFRQNGLTVPDDIHALPIERLREIFGADAAVYLRVTDYGTRYFVIGSDTRASIEARIIDLRDGSLLWQGAASASSSESGGGNQQGLTGLLIRGIVGQIVGTVTDAGYGQAALANQRLLGVQRDRGILPGPRARSERLDTD